MSRDRHPLSASQQEELERAKRAARRVGLIFPLGLLTVALVLVLIWMPRMPDPAATHWSGTGAPDGFGSPWSYVWILLLAGHGLVLLMWGFIAYSDRIPPASPKRATPIWSGYQRFLAAFIAGFSVLMAITMIGSVTAQLDVADAADARGIGLPLVLGFGSWVLVSVIGWFVQPGIEVRRVRGDGTQPLPLSKTERAVWVGEVRPSKPFVWIVGLTLLLCAVTTVIVFVASEPVGARITMACVLALILALAVSGAWFRVRIDEAGLEARSIVGWPVFRLPAGEVQSVEAAQINPIGEFGGWGVRWAPGRFGLVMRTGEGMIATRRDGRIFAVTVDGADQAAAALAAAAQRAEGGER